MKIVVVLTLVMMCCYTLNAQVFSRDSLLRLADRHLKMDSINVLKWSEGLSSQVQKQFERDSLASMSLVDSLERKYSNQRIQRLTKRRDSVIRVIEIKRDSVFRKVGATRQSWQHKLNSIHMDGKLAPPEFPGDLIRDLPSIEWDDLAITSKLDVQKWSGSGQMNALMSSNFGLPEKIAPAEDALNKFNAAKSDPGKIFEQHLLKMGEVSKTTEYLQAGDGVSQDLLSKAKAMQDPEALKKLAGEEIAKKALDHFAGQGMVVQEAMEKISKYKARYSRISSLSEIPSLPRNSLRGKPFAERFVPGCAMQYRHNGEGRVDLNPYAYYRISGMFSVGGGWSQRMQVVIGSNQIAIRAPSFGPRIFGEFKARNGVSGHAEVEGMRVLGLAANERHPGEWSVIVRVGLKTEYRLYRNIKGIAQILMPVATTGGVPIPRELFTRFGVEFPLKK